MTTAAPLKNLIDQDYFLVRIDGFKDAAYLECSELSAEIGKVETWFGGAKIANKRPGKLRFTDITLKQALTENTDMHVWIQTCLQFAVAGVGASQAVGLADGAFKRNMEIELLDRDGTTRAKWGISGAWVVKHVAFEKLDGKAEETISESMTITYDFYERIA